MILAKAAVNLCAPTACTLDNMSEKEQKAQSTRCSYVDMSSTDSCMWQSQDR